MSYVAQGVGVHIGSAVLLDDASLELAAGEIVAVAGPNGAGKTTLLSVLAGDRRPDRGRVMLDGRPIADWPRARLARRRAVMRTERDVAFGFSAREVALMGRLPLHGGDPDASDRAVVTELLEAVDCTGLADHAYATLSSGERQRVQLARAVAQVSDSPGGIADGARYLLLDEPTSSLDPAHQHTAMRLLRRLADHGLGVLVVLHDLNLAAAYADRIMLMHRAQLVETGRPRQVLRADLLEAVFEIPMLVMPHPHLAHPLVVAEPHGAGPDGTSAETSRVDLGRRAKSMEQ